MLTCCSIFIRYVYIIIWCIKLLLLWKSMYDYILNMCAVEYSVRSLHVCLSPGLSILYVCPILTLTLSRFTAKLLWMLPRDSCLKGNLLTMLLKDMNDNSTKQQYLPYSTSILEVFPIVINRLGCNSEADDNEVIVLD